MDGINSPPLISQLPSELRFTPLIISLVGITCTALAILSYHFILTRYCIRRRQDDQIMIDGGTGVDEKILESIPILSYSTKQGGSLMFRVDQNDCVVCLGELQEGHMVRLLPSCGHSFHLHCIDKWFVSHSSCPLCRSLLMESKVTVEVEGEGAGSQQLQVQVHGTEGQGGSVACDSVL